MAKKTLYYVDLSLNIVKRKPKGSYYGPFDDLHWAEHQVHICLYAAHG